ncbi:hypothetical protein [Aquihabitans sp. McL0605]|uniref:hypothetical protein n=1 Tax=Aquihabitans sp. McL0605 TaxID=3415671 RepID=UPI003CF35FAB
MAVTVRLAIFSVALLVAFGAAFGLGRAVGPIGGDASTPGPSVTTTMPMDHGSHP